MIWKTSKRRLRDSFICLAIVLLYSGAPFADQAGQNQPHIVEMFTSDKYQFVHAKGVINVAAGLDITIYKIDGIASIEHDLSVDMPAEPTKSKQIALHRIQHLGDQTRTKMKLAAQGLVKAMQYGVNRYPAIVFDGQAVVYGVADMQAALAHYQAWRLGDKR